MYIPKYYSAQMGQESETKTEGSGENILDGQVRVLGIDIVHVRDKHRDVPPAEDYDKLARAGKPPRDLPAPARRRRRDLLLEATEEGVQGPRGEPAHPTFPFVGADQGGHGGGTIRQRGLVPGHLALVSAAAAAAVICTCVVLLIVVVVVVLEVAAGT